MCIGAPVPTAHTVIAQDNVLGIGPRKPLAPTGQPPPGSRTAERSSIPNIFLVKFNSVFPQQPAVLVLKGHLLMVFPLIADIAFDDGSMRWANRKHPIATLPLEIVKG